MKRGSAGGRIGCAAGDIVFIRLILLEIRTRSRRDSWTENPDAPPAFGHLHRRKTEFCEVAVGPGVAASPDGRWLASKVELP